MLANRKHLRLYTLFTMLISTSFIFTGFATADEITKKKKTTYRVNFNQPEVKTDSLVNNNKQANNIATNQSDLKIILFHRGAGLILKPGALKSTKLEFGDSDNSTEKNIADLKNQGMNFIACKNISAAGDNDEAFRNVSSNTITNNIDAELQRLKSLGYDCVRP